MEWVARIQILDEVVYVSLRTNYLRYIREQLFLFTMFLDQPKKKKKKTFAQNTYNIYPILINKSNSVYSSDSHQKCPLKFFFLLLF